MQIICLSRGTLSGGKQLAERLANKLGYACLSREDLIEAAIHEGIQVGKLETAMLKPGLFNERLALERDYYVAFTTSYLCDRAKGGSLVYHGRTGHLLLPGVSHVLRVRVVADWDYRLKVAMQQLGVDRAKAQRYVEDVDEDRRRWAHNLYGVSLEDVTQYDLVVNLGQLNVENAAAALTVISQLPDFQMTPGSRKLMDNLQLAAKVRLSLSRDERTCRSSFRVRADSEIVTVTYLPREAQAAKAIRDVVASLEGIKEVRATMASTNLLWIQEEFKPQSEVFGQVVEIATKWNAAVELIRLNSDGQPAVEPAEAGASLEMPLAVRDAPPPAYNGGIEDDVDETDKGDDGGLKIALDELARLGRSGGGRKVFGGQEQLLKAIDRTASYSLVVIGEVFLDKGHAARTRLSRELRSLLYDHIRAPVVTSDELKTQYLFTKRDAFRLLAFLSLTFLIYYFVFTHQYSILLFLTGNDWKDKIAAAGVVVVLIPIVAYLYGNVAKAFLKLIKME